MAVRRDVHVSVLLGSIKASQALTCDCVRIDVARCFLSDL